MEEKDKVSTGYNKGLPVMGIVSTTKATHNPSYPNPATWKQNQAMMSIMS